MRLECRFTAPILRDDLGDYVREIEIDVLSYDEEISDTCIVGKISLNQILWSQATVDGESLFEVCDNDSQGLHDIYMILTKGKSEFRKDLAIEELFHDVMFVHRFLLHSEAQPFRMGVLEAALTLFGEQSLAVMWMGEGEFTPSELAQLGFAKVAGTNLIYRHSFHRSPFSNQHPRGLECDLHARPEHEEWIKREWKRPIGFEADSAED